MLDTAIGPDDFDAKSYDICPGADPTAVSQTEKLLKSQGLMELMGQLPQAFDPIEIISRVLEAQEQPNWQKVFSKEVQQSGQLPPPPPDPKLMAIQAKMKSDQQKAGLDMQQKQQDMQLDGRDKVLKLQMAQQEHTQKMENTQQSAMVKGASDIAMANIFASAERTKTQQKLVNDQATHNQKMINEKEKAKLQKQTLKSGSNKKAPKT